MPLQSLESPYRSNLEFLKPDRLSLFAQQDSHVTIDRSRGEKGTSTLCLIEVSVIDCQISITLWTRLDRITQLQALSSEVDTIDAKTLFPSESEERTAGGEPTSVTRIYRQDPLSLIEVLNIDCRSSITLGTGLIAASACSLIRQVRTRAAVPSGIFQRLNQYTMLCCLSKMTDLIVDTL